MKSFFQKTYRRVFRHPILLLFSASLLSAWIFDFSADAYTPFFLGFLCFAFAALLTLVIFWKTKGTLTEGRLVFLVTAAAFLVKLAYVVYTGLKERQHDIGSFREDSLSHSGYIFQLYSKKAFPASASGQYYHPPLHYIIEAAWLKILTFFGVAFESAVHYVTALTLFYSSAAAFAAYKAFKELHFSKLASVLCYALVAFHPTFIILSASYNNDMLSIAFTFLALLYLIRWWKTPTFSGIALAAIGIGLGMMTKLSAAAIAPGAAILFIAKFVKEKQKRKLAGEFALFGVIALPAGTWWSFWLFHKFGLPFGYVMKLRTLSRQYVGFRPVGARLFDLFGGLSQGIYFARGAEFQNDFHEYNIPSAVLKTSIFGEWHIGEGFSVTQILAYVLFIINAVLIAFSLFCMVYALFKKYPFISRGIKVFLYAFYLTVVATYVRFAFSFAHDCSMDFRYIVPTLVIGAAFIGMFLSDQTKGPFKTPIKIGILCVSAAFCVCSALLYLLSGFATN